MKRASCTASLTAEQVARLRRDYSLEELTYFSQVAFGNDLGTLSPTIHRWNKQLVNVKIMTSCKESERKEVNRILNDINSISHHTKFLLNSKESDLKIYFVSRKEIKDLFAGHQDDANGTFGFSTTMCGEIVSARLAVANDLSFKGWEEVSQSIGLPKDTDKYEKSVFSSNRQIFINDVSENTYKLFATDYLPIDRKLIDILYNSGIPINTSVDDFCQKALKR